MSEMLQMLLGTLEAMPDVLSFGNLLYAVIETGDGGFLLGGSSRSAVSGNKTTGHEGRTATDIWVVNVDGDGNKLWERNIGGAGTDFLVTMIETS